MTDKTMLPRRIIDAHNHLWDGQSPSSVIEVMDANNIDATILLGLPQGSNEDVLRAMRQFPDRLAGGAYLDPREGDKAITELRHWNAEGFRVVKLFPNFGYFPDDETFLPFFDAIAELKMAVLSHCGWLAPKYGVTAAYYSHPGRFEKVIRRFPETIFIMAHMGGIDGFLESVMLTTRTPNTYVDCSPGQGLWVLECTGAIAGSIPPEKILWGSDCMDIEEMLTRSAGALSKLGFERSMDKIYYENARAILDTLGLLSSGG